MKIALIGAGNLATHLGKALHKAGFDLTQVYSRTMKSAQKLADALGTEAVNDIACVKDADVYIMAVKDDALKILIPQLAPKHTKAVFLHTAGSVPMDVFKGYALHYGVFYPMQTFSKEKDVVFEEIPCFVEASDKETLERIKDMAKSVSRSVYELSSEQRKRLHLAAVFACNFVNHCYDLAAGILSGQGVPFDILLPLIDETARKVHNLSPHEAQTGPAVRYDEQVINRHIALIEDPQTREIYKLLSQSIHDKL